MQDGGGEPFVPRTTTDNAVYRLEDMIQHNRHLLCEQHVRLDRYQARLSGLKNQLVESTKAIKSLAEQNEALSDRLTHQGEAQFRNMAKDLEWRVMQHLANFNRIGKEPQVGAASSQRADEIDTRATSSTNGARTESQVNMNLKARVRVLNTEKNKILRDFTRLRKEHEAAMKHSEAIIKRSDSKLAKAEAQIKTYQVKIAIMKHARAQENDTENCSENVGPALKRAKVKTKTSSNDAAKKEQ